MADDAPAPASGAPPIDYNAIIQQIMQGSGPVTGPAAPATPAVNPNLPMTSLLGEAFGGGVSPLYPMSEAQQTQAGNAALLNFGIGMLQNASGPVRHSLGQAVASGLLGAQGSLAGVREGQAQMLDVQNKQQQMNLERLKVAMPLLQYEIGSKAAADALNAARGNTPASGGGIAATGAPITTIARDPSIPTVGQQANNSGNLMVPQGGSLPAGSIGVVPASGGRMVAAFPDASTGIAAQSDNLAGYANAGVNTIRGAVNRWVGDPKANTDSYVADIAKAAGVDPDAKIDLTNPAIQRAFFMAQQPHESGKPWLNPADVDKGIALAAARRTAPPGATRTATAPPTPTTASPATPAPYKVASTGATPPPPSGASTAPVTTGLPVPPIPPTTTPPAGPTAPTIAQGGPPTVTPPAQPTPQVTTPPSPYPDVTSGDVTIRHPGSPGDYLARNMPPTALPPAVEAELDRRLNIASTMADPAAKMAEINKIAADRSAAMTAQATADRTAVQGHYDEALKNYNTAANSRFTFNQDVIKSQSEKQDAANQKMLEPYETGATQAQQILGNIDLAKQVLPMLPDNASPWLADEANRKRLAVLEPYLPANWQEAVKGSDLFSQAMGGMVSAMGANVVSGQPGGREAAYEQFRSMLPTLSQSAQGREMALSFMQELAQRRISEAEFMQGYRTDPANRDPTLQVANMGKARSAMDKALGPMIRLPPSGYDPNMPTTDPNNRSNNQRYMSYFNNIPAGGRYYSYGQDERGNYHPVARIKQPGQKVPEGGLE